MRRRASGRCDRQHGRGQQTPTGVRLQPARREQHRPCLPGQHSRSTSSTATAPSQVTRSPAGDSAVVGHRIGRRREARRPSSLQEFSGAEAQRTLVGKFSLVNFPTGLPVGDSHHDRRVRRSRGQVNLARTFSIYSLATCEFGTFDGFSARDRPRSRAVRDGRRDRAQDRGGPAGCGAAEADRRVSRRAVPLRWRLLADTQPDW